MDISTNQGAGADRGVRGIEVTDATAKDWLDAVAGRDAATPLAHNFVAVRKGRVAAICSCCGRRSRPVDPDDQGQPDLWNLARGWSTAPYPADCKHRDGSMGSTFHCPTCNRRLYRGETLQQRAYLHADQAAGFVRRLA